MRILKYQWSQLSRPASSYRQLLPMLPVSGQKTQDKCLLLPLSIWYVVMLSKVNAQKESGGGTSQSLPVLELTEVVGFVVIVVSD